MKYISSKFKIIFAYALFGSLWIFFSDQILATFVKDIDTLNTIQSFKGWFFILITSFLLFYLITLFEKERNKIEKKLREKDILLMQQSKMASMGEMIDNIAHQWKQPLNMISTCSSGIAFQKEMNILTDEKLLEEIKSINSSTKYLTETIDDFRNFFNINKTKTNFSLMNCINRVFLLVNFKIKNKNIEVIKNIKDCQIFGVENEIVQVLVNIVSNAIDALDEIKENRYIFITSYIENNQICISIKDNAGGIPKNIINKIFESRFTTKEENGTGIGLYMSKNIITSYKGNIVVENIKFNYNNEDRKGANFKITIPMYSEFIKLQK